MIKLRDLINDNSLLLYEFTLPDRSDMKKLSQHPDVQEYYGNTAFNLKIFKQWSNNSGEYKESTLFKGYITGNYSKDNYKFGLKLKTGKVDNTIAVLYIPKEVYDKIINGE
jgi:hypothetical protein